MMGARGWGTQASTHLPVLSRLTSATQRSREQPVRTAEPQWVARSCHGLALCQTLSLA